MNLILLGIVFILSIPIITILALLVFHFVIVLFRCLLLWLPFSRARFSQYLIGNRKSSYDQNEEGESIKGIPKGSNYNASKVKQFIYEFIQEFYLFWIPLQLRRQKYFVSYSHNEKEHSTNKGLLYNTPEMVKKVADDKIEQLSESIHSKSIIPRGKRTVQPKANKTLL